MNSPQTSKPTAADKELGRALNIQASVIVQKRAALMEEGVHFSAGPPLAFTAEGVAMMRRVLSLPEHGSEFGVQGSGLELPPPLSQAFTIWTEEADAPTLNPEPCTLNEAATPPQEASLLVLHRLPNPIFVRVRLPDQTAYDLRVRRNARLSPRMLLRCVAHEGGWKCVQPGYAPIGQ